MYVEKSPYLSSLITTKSSRSGSALTKGSTATISMFVIRCPPSISKKFIEAGFIHLQFRRQLAEEIPMQRYLIVEDFNVVEPVKALHASHFFAAIILLTTKTHGSS